MTEPRPLEEIAMELHQVAVHLLRRLRKQDEAIGLSPARLSALSVLLHGPVSLSVLAAAEQVTQPSINRTVAGLEAAGLVTRTRSPEDGRSIVVTMTAEGTRVMERGRSLRVRHLAKHLAELSGAELEVLEKALPVLNRTNRSL